MKKIDKLLKEVRQNNLDLIAKQYDLDKEGRKQLEIYKKVFGHNWEYHFRQWWLWNTQGGEKQRNKYCDFIFKEKR